MLHQGSFFTFGLGAVLPLLWMPDAVSSVRWCCCGTDDLSGLPLRERHV